MLLRAQADLLASTREVVACATVGQPRSLAGDEERGCGAPEQPVTLGSIGDELRYHGWVEREQPFPAELPATHAQHAVSGIEVAIVERKCLADPEAGGRDEPEQGRTGQPAQA
jgi:hypothetical protein